MADPLPSPGDYTGIDWTTSIVLQSCDTPPMEFCVTRQGANLSGLVHSMLEDMGEPSKDEPVVIPVLGVRGTALKYVVQYMEYHATHKPEPIEKPLRNRIEDVISDWDKNFIFVELVKDHESNKHPSLTDVCMAANFLAIRPLLELCTACMASMLKGRNSEQIRNLFGIKNNFSKEEEEKVRAETRWCETP